MYMYICICISMYIYARVCIRIYACICFCMFVCTCIHVYVCVCMYTLMHPYVYTCVCMFMSWKYTVSHVLSHIRWNVSLLVCNIYACIRILSCIFLCMYMHVYVSFSYICMYIHTCICMQYTHVYSFVYVYACMYVQQIKANRHTHTYTHTHTYLCASLNLQLLFVNVFDIPGLVRSVISGQVDAGLLGIVPFQALLSRKIINVSSIKFLCPGKRWDPAVHTVEEFMCTEVR